MDNTTNSFMGLFGSKIRRQLLLGFYLNPQKEYYTRELTKSLQQNVGNVSRELKKIESSGLIVSRNLGNILLYQANTASPIFAHFQALVLKTIGVEAMLRPAVSGLKSIPLAFIYGSYAKGNFEAESDIDLLIIGSPDEATLDSLWSQLHDFESQINREISFDVISEKELKKKIALKSGFFDDIIQSKKIFIKGGENEFRLLVGQASKA